MKWSGLKNDQKDDDELLYISAKKPGIVLKIKQKLKNIFMIFFVDSVLATYPISRYFSFCLRVSLDQILILKLDLWV